MKLNISYPATGCQKLIEVDDEKKVRFFYEKRISTELGMDPLGDEWKGYVVRISGGNDKQGFPMKQGVMVAGRVRLLLSKGHSCYRPRRSGERKRKSVRGCIVDNGLSVLSLVIIKKGEQEIPGLTDKTIPRRLGPKRASKIRKLFNLSKEDDVRQYVVRRPLPAKEGKKARSIAPKIQRLITPLVLQRKRHRVALKRKRAVKRREDAAEYAKLLAQRMKEVRDKKHERRRSASHSKSRDSLRESTGAKLDVKATTKAASKAAKATKGAKDAKGTKSGKPTKGAPGKDKKAPGKDKKAPSKDKKAPSKDKKAPSKDKKAPSKDKAAPSKDKKAPSKDKKPKSDKAKPTQAKAAKPKAKPGAKATKPPQAKSKGKK